MGEVYLARDLQLGRRVALKVIGRDRARAAEDVALFVEEARHTAAVSHPNIVTVFAVGDHAGQPYLALEYLPGPTLADRLKPGRPGLKSALRVALAVAEALAAAHAAHVVHRDLKPANVLLPHDGRPRVVDFGLAKVLQRASAELDESDAAMTRRGGTPPYMAPERWRGESGGPPTDIWSLGVMLAEMIWGRRPYAPFESDMAQLAAAVCAPDPAPSAPGDLPSEIVALVDGCLQKDPAGRPTAAMVAARLSMMLNAAPPSDIERGPFRGLLPFTEDDAGLFFGRDAEIAAACERLRDHAVLAIVGPSGAGKSSLVRAGIVPRLAEEAAWLTLYVRPGRRPLESLAARLLARTDSSSQHSVATEEPTPRYPLAAAGPLDPTADSLRPAPSPLQSDEAPSLEIAELVDELTETPGRLAVHLQALAVRQRCRVLLVVDQLEEVRAAESDPSHAAFLRAVAEAADDPREPVRVILTIRDDFLGRIAGMGPLQAALDQILAVRTPGAEALRAALVEPLEASGHRFDDPGLVDDIVAQSAEAPLGLPLLQFAARALWDRRDRTARTLRREDYEAIGGVAGALADHAERVLSTLPSGQLMRARQILLSLVRADGTRRMASQRDLQVRIGPGAAEVVDRLVDARLLARHSSERDGAATVELELAHEALVSSWPRLSRWLQESKEEVSLHHELEDAAQAWARRGRRSDEGWSADTLEEADRHLARSRLPLSETAQDFLGASRQQLGRQARQRRFLTLAAVGALVVVAIAAVSAAWAFRDRARVAVEHLAISDAARAAAELEGARAAWQREDLVQARAKLRASIEIMDSVVARSLWWTVSRQRLLWSHRVEGELYTVDYAPDGRSVALAMQSTLLPIIDVESGAMRYLRGHRDQVLDVVHVGRGERIVSTDWSGEVRLWTVATGTSRVIRDGGGVADQIAVSPDGGWVALALNRSVEVWSLVDDRPAVRIPDLGSRLRRVAFSPDGRHLAIGEGGKVRVVRWQSGEAPVTIGEHEGFVEGVTYTPDGRHVAGAGQDRSVRLWRADGTGEARRFIGHEQTVVAVDFSRDGTQMASASNDGTIRIWNVQDGTELAVIEGGSSQRDVAFSPRGDRLASVGEGELAKLWAVDRGAPRRVHSGHHATVREIAFDPEGRTLASAADDRTARLWDLQEGRVIKVVGEHRLASWGVAFQPGRGRLASTGEDSTVRIWDLSGSKAPVVLRDHAAPVSAVVFSEDGRRMVTASWDSVVRLWDSSGPGRPQVLRTFEGCASGLYTIALGPDGRQIAAGAFRGDICLWSAARGGAPRILKGPAEATRGVSFLDRAHLVTSSDDGKTRTWDLRSGVATVVHDQPGARAYWSGLDPTGSRLGVPFSDNVARVIDLDSAAVLELIGHQAEVAYVRFGPQGRRIATSSDDGTVRLFDARSGRPIWRGPALLTDPPRLLTHRGWLVPGTTSTTSAGELVSARADEFQITSDDSTISAAGAASGWRAAIEDRARRADQHAASKTICIHTFDGAVELWDEAQDVLLGRVERPGLADVMALPRACVFRSGDRVQRLTKGDATEEILAGGRLLAPAKDGALVVTDDEVIELGASGQRRRELDNVAGASALLETPNGWVVGYGSGGIERRSAGDAIPFEGTPSSPVTGLLDGPAQIVAAGFGDGHFGLWTSEGTLLDLRRLHGRVQHLRVQGHSVYAATDLGDHAVLDLEVLVEPYCRLVRRIWSEVPVVWEDGRPMLRPAPRGHRCTPDPRSG